MFNRLTSAGIPTALSQDSPSAAQQIAVRNMVARILRIARHAVTVLGITALGAIGIMFVKPELTDHLKALSPFAQEEAPKVIASDPPVAALLNMSATADGAAANGNTVVERPRHLVTNWISKRYRVATDATQMLVSAVYQTADELKLDPLLVLAVMAIESRFNPFAESPVGAQGLMQVMSKVHREKFEDHGGVQAALNPVANIKVGSRILKEYVRRGGSVEAGLKLYVGAGALDTDFGYGAKVLAEYAHLKNVAMGKKVSIYATNRPSPAPATAASSPAETAPPKPTTATNEQPEVAVEGEQIAAL